MSRLTYEEASKLGLGTIQVIDNKSYQLLSMIYYEDRIELGWRSVILIFLEHTMIKFPGTISYHRLNDLLDFNQLPDKPCIMEVVYK